MAAPTLAAAKPTDTELTDIVVQAVPPAGPAVSGPNAAKGSSTVSTMSSLKQSDSDEQDKDKPCCLRNFSIVDIPFFLGQGGSVTAVGYGFLIKTAAVAYGGVAFLGLFALSHAGLRYYQYRAKLKAIAKELEEATKIAAVDIKEGSALNTDLQKREQAAKAELETLKKAQIEWQQRENDLTQQIAKLTSASSAIQASDRTEKAANEQLTKELSSVQSLLTQYKTFLSSFNAQFNAFLQASQKAQTEGAQIEAVDFKLDHTVQQLGTRVDSQAREVSEQLVAAKAIRDQFMEFSRTFFNSLQARIQALEAQVKGFQETEVRMKADTEKLGQITEREARLFAAQESLQKEREEILAQKEANLKLLAQVQEQMQKLQAERAAISAQTGVKVQVLDGSALDAFTKSADAETAELDKLLHGDAP